MPLRERSVVDQREELVMLALAPGANKSEVFRHFGVSRSKGYKWLLRYAVEGRAGLADRSRRPSSSPLRTPQAIEAEVLRVRAESNNAWGGRKIARVLEREGALDVPAPSTITEILRRNGRLEANAIEHPGPLQRFERERPNELWQMDFKGHFATGSGRCYPLTVLDDHSRYSLGVEACGNQEDRTARDQLTAVFERYGLPERMLMDNGPPWGDSGGGPFTSFTVWLLRLGVPVSHGRPYHPQTQGKDERFHRTLKAEVLRGRHFADLTDCQRAFDDWRPRYNHERPHQAIDMATPAERYQPSSRPFPARLPPVEYGPGDLLRKADKNGDVWFKNHLVRLGNPFRGEFVAVRPTAKDGVFSIHFCAHHIGTIDLTAAPSVCGRVDITRAMPTSPQLQKQQQNHPDRI
jgi:transposase InsO family protein